MTHKDDYREESGVGVDAFFVTGSIVGVIGGLIRPDHLILGLVMVIAGFTFAVLMAVTRYAQSGRDD
jgi:hypothetical protein